MSKDPRSYLQRAEDHRRHGRLKEAISACREALAEHPGLDAARITLGRALLESGDAAAAAETLGEVFARLPEHHLAGRTLAEAQRRLGDFAGAETTCRGILEHYPRDREIEPLLAAILEEKKGGEGSVPPAPRAAAKAPVGAPVAAVAATAAPPGAAAARSAPPLKAAASHAAAATVAAAKPATPQPPPAPAVVAAVAVAAPDPAPEYSPEDVEISSPPGLVNVGQAGASVKKPDKPPEPTPAAAPRPARSGGDALATNTLAELYLRQGMTERAVAVYRNMLRVEPGNAAVRRRLAEIEGREEGSGVVVTARPAAAAFVPVALSAPAAASVASHAALHVASAPVPAQATSAAAVPSSTPKAPAAPAPPAPARGLNPAEKAAVERLERWLEKIQDTPVSHGADA